MAEIKASIKVGDYFLAKCRYGIMLFDGPWIGESLRYYGEWSESEVEVFKNFLKEGSTALDIGAFIGDTTLPMAHLVGQTGRVFAFESNPKTFNVLCANLAMNGILNVKPVNAFVADSEKENTGNMTWGKFANIGETWPATFYSLDQLDCNQIDFIKIDVDGHELSVLRSAAAIIQKFNPVIYYENDIKDLSPPIIEYLFSYGYRIFFHAAPMFNPTNFFGVKENIFENKFSLMMLAIPKNRKFSSNLREVFHSSDWWR